MTPTLSRPCFATIANIQRLLTGVIILSAFLSGSAGWCDEKKSETPGAGSPPTREQAFAAIKNANGKFMFEGKENQGFVGKEDSAPVSTILLKGKGISDPLVLNVAAFPELQKLLIIYPAPVTDAGLPPVAGLKNLTLLDLEGTLITDKGLSHLKGLTSLTELKLTGTRVDGSGFVHLKGSTHLRRLRLGFTDVDDEHLASLAEFRELRQVELDDSKVTEAGVNRLRKALPKCQVSWSALGVAAVKTSPQSTAGPAKALGTEPGGSPEITPGDWSQWRGPNRDALCRETGLLKQWPAEGPPLKWEAPLKGRGYSSVVVHDGKLFLTETRNRTEYLLAFGTEKGEPLWEIAVVEEHDDVPHPTYSTPTVDGDVVYALSHQGALVCVDSHTGDITWRRHLANELGGDFMSRGMGGGYAESVLIDKDVLVCTPGAKDAAMAGLNKRTGETIWKATLPPDVGPQGVDFAGFSSPVISNACGVRQYIQLSGRGLISVAANDGKTLWAYNKIAVTHANVATPIVAGDYVFAATAMMGSKDSGSALLKLRADGGGVRAEEVYRLPERTACNHHGGMVLVGDYVYFGHGYNKGYPLCLELTTGKVAWRPGRGPGSGSASVLYADGHIYFRYEDGTMALVEATPVAYRLTSTFKLPTDVDAGWAHPVIAGGCLYVRQQERLLCYDIQAH